MNKLISLALVLVGIIGISLVIYSVNYGNELTINDYMATFLFSLVTAVGVSDLIIKPIIKKL